MILFKKIIAIIVAAVCFMQGINVIAQSTTEIINISADDKCISWDYSGDDYKGANVYLLDKNNTLLLQGTTTDTAYTCSSNGNYVVRAYSSSGESKGKIITVTDEVPFEVSLDGCKYNNGYITYEVRVSNISSAYASGIVAVRAVDADGNTTRYTYSKVTLEPGKEEAFRTSFKISDDTETIAVCVWDSKIAQNLLSNEILNVCRDNIAGNLVSTLNAQAEELSVLIEKCENQGITTDYEEINYNVIKMFSGYVQEDLENGDIDRIEYTKRTTNQLYVDAKENLEAYLAGEKKPLSVPKYVTSDVAVKSKAMYAMTDNNGVKEERPVFFVGYCGHEMAIRDLSSFDELGTNSIQMEVGPASLMSNGNKWEFYYANNPDADYMLSDGPDEASKSIKVVYNSEILSNRFFSMSQTLSVQGGTTYVVSGKVKSENAESFCLSPNNYYNRFVFDTGTYDWKDFSFEYTVPSGVRHRWYKKPPTHHSHHRSQDSHPDNTLSHCRPWPQALHCGLRFLRCEYGHPDWTVS